MSSVVSFLTMLERDAAESNGNVRRMLSVCSEFERIAKVVLDKAEHELKGRGKRKQAEREKEKDRRDGNSISTALDEGKTIEMIQVETQAAYRRPIQTPSLRRSMESSQQNSPASWSNSPAGGTGPEYKTPGSGSESGFQVPQKPQQQNQQQATSGQWNPPPNFDAPNGNSMAMSFAQQQQDFTGNTQSPPQPPPFSQPGMPTDFNPATTDFSPPDPSLSMDMSNGFSGNPADMMGAGSFQQPFVPQDLWQMPMTLEWDWAEGLGLGSFTPGPLFDAGYGLDGDATMGGQMAGQGGQ